MRRNLIKSKNIKTDSLEPVCNQLLGSGLAFLFLKTKKKGSHNEEYFKK